ncbi:MAG: SusD/RagB family nutrient-binding outer membrane lipoprotein [Bacteroidales bacterium]|nr:SusD/RagB family nutrient-binding outer membrane lipoprotein [Bacteroidales bacterium]MDY6001733.1 SusD/RagB family nutrient-binding outer membrane lipoprotein [Candidatus Cryptobacteroides sp.]
MKLLKSILLCGVAGAGLSLTSCGDWLDVNTDPINPTLNAATYDQELASIEFYVNSATQFAAWRSSMAMGDWTRYVSGGTYYNMSIWYPTSGPITTPYQWFLVGAGPDIVDMKAKALAAEQYHFAGVADILYAYGFMLMTDLYGEMPFTDALGENALPVYDNGKTIYVGCLKYLDEGLEYLSKSVDPNMTQLSVGDYWANGDVNKWIKFGNLLKARWINKLIKKGTGSYLEGKYDAQAILDALSKGPLSITDNMTIFHTDNNSATHDHLGWNEPVDYSPLFSVCGINAGYMVTKMLYDNLTNFDGLGVEDPRADKIIPWAYSGRGADSPAEIKWSGNWRRSLGVNMSSNIQQQGGPLRASYDATGTNSNNASGHKGWTIYDKNAERWGDTVYVEQTSRSKGYNANVDLFFRMSVGNDNSRESGTFYTRVSSPTYVGTYSEACFIKAEVLFRQGNISEAYAAYREGIKASMEQMNIQLKSWIAGDSKLADCPSFTPMTNADMENFLDNGIGTTGTLTLGRILTQKRLSLMFSVEIWNDMRRYDFDKSIFLGWNVPAQHYLSAAAQRAIPDGKQFRRWQQCSHERNYNGDNLQAIGHEVPGALELQAAEGVETWQETQAVWTIPVWWDSDQE